MDSHTIELITDTTCDIPQNLVEQYGITVLPHTIVWGDEQFRDRVDLQPEQFYRRLISDRRWPTTSQVTVRSFFDAFMQAKDRGAREIVTITLSGQYSGAMRSAQIAADGVDIPVHVVDSRQTTMGLGWQVLAAARARECGASAAEMLATVEKTRQHTWLYVAMDTVEYLYRGGRIGNAGRLVGSVLNVKPVVLVDHESGNTEPAGVAFTYHKVIEMMYEKFFEHQEAGKKLRVAVMHGNNEAEAKRLADRIWREHNPAETLINMTGPVLGINTGPRAMALAGYWEEEPRPSQV